MSKKILLFGEKPFEAFAHERFSMAASGIDMMSDLEALLYKDSFDELVLKTVNTYAFPQLHISFDNKVVDLVSHPFKMHHRYFAEYSLVVTGDTYFLGLSTYNYGRKPFDLLVEVRGNFLTFEIDTGYHCEELTGEVTVQVKRKYEQVRNYINATQNELNQTIEYYNGQLEKFVIPLLAEKLRKAERCLKVREALNFK